MRGCASSSTVLLVKWDHVVYIEFAGIGIEIIFVLRHQLQKYRFSKCKRALVSYKT